MQCKYFSVGLLCSLFIGCGFAQGNMHTIPRSCGKKSDAFLFLVDASGSMYQTIDKVKDAREQSSAFAEKHRMDLVRALVSRLGQDAIQIAKMESSVYSLAPFTYLMPRAQRDHEDFIDRLNEALPERLEVFGRPTWISQRGLDALGELEGKNTVILLTDGQFVIDRKNQHWSPAKMFAAYQEKHPNQCIQIVSLAYSAREKAAIARLATMNPCAKVVHIEDLLTNEEKYQEFFSEHFYKECTEAPVVEIYGVNFAFDKAVIGPNGQKNLDAVVDLIQNRYPNQKIVIRGWTDWTGTDAYNDKLSQKRAQAVRRYFVQRGLPSDLIEAVGAGKSFKYSNHTAEGRWKNRRVEIEIGDAIQTKDQPNRVAE